ncbi:MAG: hypothetical protein HGA44_05960 [Cellulomonadaceae bacterium]|nr:hypothetical protein [Cellulomonadaceae bacterium]
MTATVLLDRVAAYAAAVRSHLADLPAEQLEDLTDGLEADLAEALEDVAASVGGAVGAAGEATDGNVGSARLDLTERFGPAAEYAAELRAAAGLGAAAARPIRPHRWLQTARSTAVGVVERARRDVERLTTARWWPAVAALVEALRPLWWLMRGWAWFVIALVLVRYASMDAPSTLSRFVPRSLAGWLVLAVAVGVSIGAGRGVARCAVWLRVAAAAASAVAVLALPGSVSEMAAEVHARLAPNAYPVYIETTVADPDGPDDGVWVDGQQVSNLFVYDAAGNPLTDVQVFDDRGRPVRTTTDDGTAQWYLPGVSDPWLFAATVDVDGRDRWNVYPRVGAPVTDWYLEEADPRLVAGASLRTPPPPFAKAPALAVDATSALDAPSAASGPTGAAADAAPSSSPTP